MDGLQFRKRPTHNESITTDSEGRITITVDGAGHEISFTGPGASAQPPVLLPVTSKDKLRLEAASELPLPICIYNPRAEPMTGVRFTAGAGYFAPARLTLTMIYDGWHEMAENIDVQVIPEAVPAASAVEMLDGRAIELSVFRQKGNQGGGSSIEIERRVTEGKGNGNGELEPVKRPHSG